MHIHHMYVCRGQMLSESKIEILNSFEPPCRFGELKLGPLQDNQLMLTTNSTSTIDDNFKRTIFIAEFFNKQISIM